MIYLISNAFFGIIFIISAYFNQGNGESIYYNLFLVQLVSNITFFGIFNFIGHVPTRKKVEKSIDWVFNGFQIELGTGIDGILSYWFKDDFWLSTLIPVSVF